MSSCNIISPRSLYAHPRSAVYSETIVWISWFPLFIPTDLELPVSPHSRMSVSAFKDHNPQWEGETPPHTASTFGHWGRVHRVHIPVSTSCKDTGIVLCLLSSSPHFDCLALGIVGWPCGLADPRYCLCGWFPSTVTFNRCGRRGSVVIVVALSRFVQWVFDCQVRQICTADLYRSTCCNQLALL